MLDTANVLSIPRNISQREDAVRHALADHDHVFVSAYDMMAFILGEPGVDPLTIDAFARSWDDLGPDDYMADGGKYRARRHATMIGSPAGGPILLQPHQPHFQAIAYNPLNGGVERHFEPIRQEIIDGPVMTALLRFATSIFSALAPLYTWHIETWHIETWHIEVHQFRITAIEGLGKPTPEGTHHDGVNYVLMTLVDRRNVSGGVTSIHRNGHKVAEFTLKTVMDTALVNDERVSHGVTPVEAVHPDRAGYRDVLVVTFRRRTRFQDIQPSGLV